MTLVLRSIVNRGDAKLERVTLRATSDVEIGDYILAQAGLGNDGPLAKFQHTFWFPYKEIKTGDIIILYTRSGVESEKVLNTGKTGHFYYWGLPGPIWQGNKLSAVLLDAPTWTYKSVEELSV